MGFFGQNIEPKGRRIRAIGAVMLLVMALLAFFLLRMPWLGWVLVASSAFVAFEAARGWCALRACKIRTPF